MAQYERLTDIRNDIANGVTNLPDIVERYLASILKNEKLNAFAEVYHEESRLQAKEIQNKIDQGIAGRLAGMVIGLKDVYSHKGHRLQASSKILEGFTAQFNATIVQRLLDEDAIIIGRQNCDEFAMGSSNEHSVYGPVLNASNEKHVPGGSSGGSAVAVQAHMCLASIGSDTGGSVRQPAAYCGVIGLKPTYSRISRYGLTAYASSFDCVGTITKSIEDAALILEIIAGPDNKDSTVSQRPTSSYSELLDSSSKARIAILSAASKSEGIAQSVESSTKNVIAKLKDRGHVVEEVEFKYLSYLLPTYYILTTAEASANLSRFDGIKFGFKDTSQEGLTNSYMGTRAKGFGKEVKKRIMLGTFVLSEGYFDAYYNKAQKVRRIIKNTTEEIFKDYDFVILPTTPTTAFELNSRNRDPLEMYLEDIFTVQASLAGIPAISLPNGKDEKGLSIGLQVMANSFREQELLSFSHYLTQNKILEENSLYELEE